MTFIIIFAITILVYVIYRAIIVSTVKKVCFPAVRSWEETKEIESKYDEWSDYDSIEKEDLNFTLDDGYLIHGTFIKSKEESNKYIILTHGFRYSRLGGVKYVNIFRNLGYNIYLYDLRNHGKNVHGGIITMGEQEYKDLAIIIDRIYNKFGNNIQLGLHGESLGAFSSMFVTSLRANKIKFIIEDCGYSYTRDELLHQTNRQKLPKWMYYRIEKYALKKYNQHWKDMDAKKVLKSCTIPMLFMHGGADTFTPPKMAQELYDSHAGYKQICIIEGAEHAQSVVTDYKKYKETVNNFIKNINM